MRRSTTSEPSQVQGQTAMAQRYLDAIDTEGEVNIALFDGTYSHAVRKRPALQVGRTPVERPCAG